MKPLIVTHVNADFDGAAGAYALKKLYPFSDVLLPGSPNRNVRNFLSLHGNLFPIKEESDINVDDYDTIIAVDTSFTGRLGKASEVIGKKEIKKILYDHHMVSSSDVIADEVHIEEIGAVTTMIVERIIQEEIPLTAAEATFLALGIHEDTGSLTFKGATKRDATALSYLYEKGARPEVISQFLHSKLSEEQRALLKELLENLEEVVTGTVRILFTSAMTKKFIEGASVVAHKIVDLENCDGLVVILESEDKVYLILRSRTTDFNCLDVAKDFSPGGHPLAATAIVKDKRTEEVKEKLLKRILASRKTPIPVKNIMSTPVKYISPRHSVAAAQEIMKRYGYSGLPVVANDEVVGMITRKEIDRAIAHKLAHAPVKGFMSRHLFNIGPDEPLEVIVSMMTEKGVGRLPVIDNGKLLGIVSRTDLLKSLHGLSYFSKKYPVSVNELIQRLKNFLTPELYEMVRLTGYIAEEVGMKAYLVGGIIRDLILGFENFDIDIVIEGNAIEVAEKLSKTVGGKYDSHERFKTAVIILPNGSRIDLTSTRKEYYEKPGALPEVETSGLKEDLERRDFSINSLAMSLSRRNFGEIIDVTGGIDDIEKGLVKTLHNLSFIEDPTRIIRAIRFEKRFGFEIEHRTLALLHEAVAMGVIEKASGVRMRDEIIDILEEEKVVECLDRMKELGILDCFGVRMSFGNLKKSRIGALLRNFEKAKNWKIDVKRGIAIFSILASTVPRKKLANFMGEFKFRREQIEFVVQTVSLLHSLKDIAKKNLVDAYFELRKYNDAAVFICWTACLGEEKQRLLLEKYLDELRFLKVSISGEDIMALGIEQSRMVGFIKKEILKSKILGKVKNREDELSIAKRLLEKGKGTWKHS